MTRAATLATSLGLAAALGLVTGLPPAEAKEEPPVWENYLLNCSGCHGRDGVGVPGTTPDLHEMGRLFAAPGGREYLARVPGIAQAPMNDVALATLLNWLLDEFGGAPPPIPYEASEVGRLRSRPLRDPLSARPRLDPAP